MSVGRGRRRRRVRKSFKGDGASSAICLFGAFFRLPLAAAAATASALMRVAQTKRDGARGKRPAANPNGILSGGSVVTRTIFIRLRACCAARPAARRRRREKNECLGDAEARRDAALFCRTPAFAARTQTRRQTKRRTNERLQCIRAAFAASASHPFDKGSKHSRL